MATRDKQATVTQSSVKPARAKKRTAGKSSAKKRPAAQRASKKAGRRKPASRSARHHHHVYVIELARSVWMEPGFRRANPDGDITRPCVYVGMTGLTPDVRFDKHKAGIQDGRYVKQYGLRLLPALYEAYNPMPYEAAREMEVELAIGLRDEGYGVWQA